MLLVRAVYYSIARGPVGPSASRTQIDALVSRAMSANRARNLTSALIHDQGRYLQVIEGERGAVNALLTRLYRDCRHRDMTLAAFEEISSRRFGLWSMIHADADALKGLYPLPDYSAAPASVLIDRIEQVLAASESCAAPGAFLLPA